MKKLEKFNVIISLFGILFFGTTVHTSDAQILGGDGSGQMHTLELVLSPNGNSIESIKCENEAKDCIKYSGH